MFYLMDLRVISIETRCTHDL